MTRNQIDYAKHLETRRSNKVNEDLTRRRDAANAAIGFGNLEETKLHNRATETETNRHNVVQESLDSARNKETERSNRAREANASQQLEESRRHSLATEAIQEREVGVKESTQRESVRHNLATEEETKRSALAREAEAKRASLAAQAEINRHNRETESLGRDQLSLGYAELASLDSYRSQSLSLENFRNLETQRSNLARESESRRHNVVGESIQRGEAYEQKRHNLASEELTASAQEETHRHNRRNEQIGQVKAGVDVIDSAVRNFSTLSGGRFR